MAKHNSRNRVYNRLVKKYKRSGLSDIKAKNEADHATGRNHGLIRSIPDIGNNLSGDDLLSLGAKALPQDEDATK